MVVVADAQVAVRGDLARFESDLRHGTDRPIENLGRKLQEALTPRSLTLNQFGRGPDELARSFERASDAADEAMDVIKRLDRTNLDTSQARKYADQLDEIGIEAQQTRADLMALQAADPRFNTPQLQAAADQLDRVGREAADSARSLNQIKGVGASTEFERLANEAREAGTNLDTAGRRTDGLMGKLNSLKGVIAGLGLAIGTQQLLSFAGDSLGLFSDLEQSGRSLQTIFGDSADVIEDWGERAARAAGLSKVEVNESAAVMGQMLQNMGFSAGDAADQVVTLQQRAADLALQFGGDTADAILAVNSLLRGERDTIEKYSVTIKQADVDNRVLALGLDTSTEAAKKNADAIATLDLFMEQSANAADRFANEIDSVAVQLAQAEAEGENFQAEFGRLTASIVLGAAKTADAAADGFGLGTAFDKIASGFGSQEQTIRRIAEATGQDFEILRSKILREMEATGQSFDDVATAMEERAHFMATRIPGHVTLAMTASTVAVEDFAMALDEAKAVFSDTFGDIIAGVTEVPGGIEVALTNGTTIVGDSADSMMSRVSAAVERAEADALMAASNIPGGIAQALTDNAGALQPALDTLIGIMNGSIDVIVDGAEIAAARVALAQAEAYIAANPETAAAITSQMVLVQNILDEAAIQAKVTAGLSGTATLEEQARAMALSAWLVEQEAKGIVDLQSDQWERAVEIATERGYDTPAEFASAMDEAAYLVDNATRAIQTAAAANLNFDASAGGEAVINSWFDGMGRAYANRQAVLMGMTSRARNSLGGSLPTEGPLAGGVASGGYSIIESWFDGMQAAARDGIGTLTDISAAAGLAMSPAAAAVQGGAGGGALSRGAAMAQAGPTFILNVNGVQYEVKSAEEAIATLQGLGVFHEGRL